MCTHKELHSVIRLAKFGIDVGKYTLASKAALYIGGVISTGQVL